MVFLILTIFIGNIQKDMTFKSSSMEWCESNKDYIKSVIMKETKAYNVKAICKRVENASN